MNNSGKNENDILGKYINPERIEKAPERFTEKIMDRIRFERAPSRMPGKIQLSVPVPVISVTITLALIVLAIIFSSPADNTVLSGLMKHIINLNLAIPKIKMDTITWFSLPAIAVYIAIGCFILTLFDTALNNLFHRIGKQE
jgi:hypothetical protein